MYGTSGALQAPESEDTWLVDAPAILFSRKLLDEEPEGYDRRASKKWGGPRTCRSPSRLSKAWWSVVLFFVLLTLLPAICVHRAETRVKKGLNFRRLAGSGAPDENDFPGPDSPDLTQLCIELGPWVPAAQQPGNPRGSPAIVEEVFLALEEDSTSHTASPPSPAATFFPCDKVSWTPQPHFAVPTRQLEGDLEAHGFVLSTWETAKREAQSSASQTYPPWHVDPIFQENVADLQHAQLHSIPFEVQLTSRPHMAASYAPVGHERRFASSGAGAIPAVLDVHGGPPYPQAAQLPQPPIEVPLTSYLFADASPCAVRQPLNEGDVSASFAPTNYEGQSASSQATAAPAVSVLHESSTYFQHAQVPLAPLGVQPTARRSADVTPCAVRHPLTGPYMAASYASTSLERQPASSGAGATLAVLDVHGGAPSPQHAHLHPALPRAEPDSSLLADASPCASRHPLDEGNVSASHASTSQKRQSPSSEESNASSESDSSPDSGPSGNPNAKHPFVRLPSVKRGVLIRPFLTPDKQSMKSGPRRQVVLLRKIRELLLKNQLDQGEADRLILLAEGLANQMSVAMSFIVSEKRPYLACEQLGRRFLSLNALYCISKTLNLDWEKQEWWREFTGRIPAEYRSHFYVSPADQTDFNIRLASDLVDAIGLYKSGQSPSEDEVIDLKRRLFCMQQSPYFLKDSSWKPWRDDEKLWQKRRSNNRPKE
ncbi:hypothetical protein Emag_005149 [Eimeria magna]